MSGYIFLNRTGVPAIDDICEALECAGNAYHHTEQWCDDGQYGDPRSEMQKIQEVIDRAADAWRQKEQQSSTAVAAGEN